jgi:glycosyltransferase involved in cell wall biosynthesis
MGPYAGALGRAAGAQSVQARRNGVRVNTAAASTELSLHPGNSPLPRSIMLVGPLPPPSGGMANQTRQLAQLLAAEGCEVTTVQVNLPYRPAWIGRVRGIRAVFRLGAYVLRLRREIRHVELVHVMANSGWAWHLCAAPAIWMGSLVGVPVVVNYRGGDAEAFFARGFGRIRPTLARARAVIVPSGFLQRVFERYGVAARIVPNIVSLEAFRPAAKTPAAPHLLVARNLEPIYDVGTALRAFAIVVERFRDACLTVAGSGPDREELGRLAQELGVTDRVRFTGSLENSKLPALYGAANVVVNSSLVDNFPISLLEAMACGVPIVSTNVGGIPYLVEHERTALLVPPRNPVALANAVLRLFDDRSLALRLRLAGIEAAQRYAWAQVRADLFGVYAQACKRAPGSSRGTGSTTAR